PKEAVARRYEELARLSTRYEKAAKDLPRFFHSCFHSTALPFLVAARHELRWRQIDVDATAMALILVYLHGKYGASFSNQMRQTKAMSPGYALGWWRERRLKPPVVEPVEFLRKRLDWRYAKGIPALGDSHIYLGDSNRHLHMLKRRWPYARKR